MVGIGCETSGLLDGGQLAAREAVREVVASGFRSLDALLPAGGVRRGSLIEWLAGGPGAAGGMAGAGAMSLACAVACRLGRAAGGPRTIVVVDRTGWFHPPAVLPWLGVGAEEARLVLARPAHDDDEIWTIDQALRCVGVAAVLAWPRTAAAPGGGLVTGRRCAAQSWTIALRRWQLAARSSGAVGLFLRPAVARGEASWAEARIAVAPLPSGTLLERRLRLTRVGGVWTAGAAGDEPTADVVLDLARGTAGAMRQTTAAGTARAPEAREAACRAS
jgi:hypothetical protein